MERNGYESTIVPKALLRHQTRNRHLNDDGFSMYHTSRPEPILAIFSCAG